MQNCKLLIVCGLLLSFTACLHFSRSVTTTETKETVVHDQPSGYVGEPRPFVYVDPDYGSAAVPESEIYSDEHGVLRDRRTGYAVRRLGR